MPKLDINIVIHCTVPGKYYDNGRTGLFLHIRKTGSKHWAQRLGFEGRKREIGLGRCHHSTLAKAQASMRKAQDMAAKNQLLAREGIDPVSGGEGGRPKITFEDYARQRHKEILPTIKSEREGRKWINSLATYAFPVIGKKPIDKVEAEDIKEILLRNDFWQEKPEQARRILRRIGDIMLNAKHFKYRRDNPTDGLRKILPEQTRKTVPVPSVPYRDVPAAVEMIRTRRGVASFGLIFQILTAVRSGEVRSADWSEIDLEARIWTIPAEKMKMDREHVVPLSVQAIELLREVRALSGDENGGMIFPGRGIGNKLSNMAFTKIMRDLKLDGVPHGFRSSFSTWVQEKTDCPEDIAEAAIAHAPKNKVRAAYARSNYLEKRRPLMQMWADYVSGRPGGTVLQFERTG